MKNKKAFILLPDGVGLRNFAFTKFPDIGKQMGFEVSYWNNTPCNLTALGFNEIKISHSKSHKLTEVYKNTRKHIELNLFKQRFNDEVYDSYRFPFPKHTLKHWVKSFLTKCLIQRYNSEEKLETLKRKIVQLEAKTTYFKQCVKTLKQEQPNFVFCTNQRPMTAIAPVEAAKQLGIPTGTFIFSWDNLPKATMVIDTDYYFVWSEYMKAELLNYYPNITEQRVFVTGTPQFEHHFDKELLQEREVFFKENGLDVNKKYICFSGDDVTTSPNDPHYLEDTAKAVKQLNKIGYNLGIIFRRCPVDFSNRFDAFLEAYNDIITPINPLWKAMGMGWNTVLPTKADLQLQANTVAYTELVVNLGSSMVFDYASHNKPCAFFNYDVANCKMPNWSVKKIYHYVHFRSMPSKEAVVWFNSPEEIINTIEMVLKGILNPVPRAKEWFNVINTHSHQEASVRIWNALTIIVK